MVEVLIDGISYEPVDPRASHIGIGITTRNRPDLLATCLENVRRYTPGATVVVVDDASDKPVRKADYRFKVNAGIAKAKNKCLELLYNAGCEHIFLFDDDCWPQAEGWTVPYMNSPEPHLMYVFVDFACDPGRLKDTTVLYRDGEHVSYSHPRGCMLYVERWVLDVVGGFDSSMSGWGYEHGDWSNRIHAAGLTTFRYGDVEGSAELIYSLDEQDGGSHGSTVTRKDRQTSGRENKPVHDARWDISAYCEFRHLRDVVLAAYLTGLPDDQRGTLWTPNEADLKPLADSVPRGQLVVFSNEVETNYTVKVPVTISPYKARWMWIYRYLREHDDIRFAFCVDATDVVMLHDPFPHMEPGKLYCGSEPNILGIQWMIDNHEGLVDWIKANASLTLLNCGLIGADRETLMGVVHAMVRELTNAAIRGEHTRDMGPFNHVAYTGGYDIVTGPQVHTVFKLEEQSSVAWFKHK